MSDPVNIRSAIKPQVELSQEIYNLTDPTTTSKGIDASINEEKEILDLRQL